MRRILFFGCLFFLPGCAISERGINLNADADEIIEMANAIDSSALPNCLRDDQEDWSDIGD